MHVYLDCSLHAVHLQPQYVNDVLTMLKKKLLQLRHGSEAMHLLHGAGNSI